MKRIIIPILLFIMQFFLVKQVSALDSFCWNPTTGELNEQTITNEYGCGPLTCVDDDGVNPYCVKTPIGGTIRWSKDDGSGSYPIGGTNVTSGAHINPKTWISFYFSFNVPMWREPLLKSASIISKGNDGTTQWFDAYLPISYDYCSTGELIQNTGNFANMYFDGYEKLPVDSNPYPYTNHCFRTYARLKVRIMYLLPNQVNAVPLVQSSYYYVYSDSGLMQFYNHYDIGLTMSVDNLQYYTFNEYNNILDNIDYRNYLYDTGEIEKSYQESQTKFIEDIYEIISNTDSANTDGLNGSVGWLPAGPVDSLLNLPLSMLSNLSDSLGESCQSVNLPLPFVNKDIPLPCLNTIYNQIDGLSLFLNTTGIIASAFILYKYLLNLYKWVDDTLTFRENNLIDNWGGL